MYSRKLGVSDERGSKSLEKFNERLREQYTQKINPQQLSAVKDAPTESAPFNEFIKKAQDNLTGLDIKLDFDSILILSVILLILSDAKSPDLVLIGILASLIF